MVEEKKKRFKRHKTLIKIINRGKPVIRKRNRRIKRWVRRRIKIKINNSIKRRMTIRIKRMIK